MTLSVDPKNSLDRTSATFFIDLLQARCLLNARKTLAFWVYERHLFFIYFCHSIWLLLRPFLQKLTIRLVFEILNLQSNSTWTTGSFISQIVYYLLLVYRWLSLWYLFTYQYLCRFTWVHKNPRIFQAFLAFLALRGSYYRAFWAEVVILASHWPAMTVYSLWQ